MKNTLFKKELSLLKTLKPSSKPSLVLAVQISIAWWLLASIVEWLVSDRGETFFHHYAMMGWQEWAVRMTTVAMIFGAVVARGAMQQARKRIKQLEGMIPVCAWCKKQIKTESGSWQDVDVYLNDHEIPVTHGMCPDCYTESMKLVDELHHKAK